MYFIFMITLHPLFSLSLCIFLPFDSSHWLYAQFPFVWFTFLFNLLVYMSCLPLCFIYL